MVPADASTPDSGHSSGPQAATFGPFSVILISDSERL
jgi:hypothetical protein